METYSIGRRDLSAGRAGLNVLDIANENVHCMPTLEMLWCLFGVSAVRSERQEFPACVCVCVCVCVRACVRVCVRVCASAKRARLSVCVAEVYAPHGRTGVQREKDQCRMKL